MKRMLATLAFSMVAFAATPSFADDGAATFVQTEHGKLLALVKAKEATKVSAEIDTMVDFDAIVKRAFGAPCPTGLKTCTDHFADLSDAQKAEVKGLLKKLVEKNYRKNIDKTVDYDVTVKKATESGGETKVRTSAKSKANTREAPVTVDYIVIASGGGYKVVDIVTEGSSLSKNYYDQFHKMLTTSGQGYGQIVKKLNEKLAK